jgi:hypothetical protein
MAEINDTVNQLYCYSVTFAMQLATLLKKNIASTGFSSFSEANLKETSCKTK